MSGDIIKMNRPKMEAMSAAFQQSAQVTSEVLAEMQKIGGALEDGALLGKAGSLFADTVNSNLVAVLNKFQDKLEELDKDIIGAVEDLYGADQATSGLF